jgi:hypothetical protein
VIDSLLIAQSFLIDLGYILFFAPDDIPIISFCASAAALLEGSQDAVGEIGLKFDGWA